jgi:iduronate 2-sulfatase
MNEGRYSDVLVEQLDIFPTLIEASGIGFTDQILDQLQGKSLYNIIKFPEEKVEFPQYAYSQYPRMNNSNSLNVMGLSLRTTQWRYTEWIGFAEPYLAFNWSLISGLELYNHSSAIDSNDFNAYDNYNYAYEADMQDTVQQLHDILYSTWDNQTWNVSKQIELA